MEGAFENRLMDTVRGGGGDGNGGWSDIVELATLFNGDFVIG